MISNTHVPKYEAFNARYLSIDQLVDTFIPTKNFNLLLANSHTLLMGPRGCGKTTLLKMLTPIAISKFNNKKNKKDSINPPFIGIYIPADKQWESQIDRFSKKFSNNLEFVEIILQEIVNLNVLVAVCETFQQLLQVMDYNEDDIVVKEAALSKELKRIFDITVPIPLDIYHIKQSLKHRIKEINTLSNKIYRKVTDPSILQYPDYFFKSYLDLITLATDAFEQLFEESAYLKSKNCKWALCFDELEIAPRFLQQELISTSLRSINQKILFKLTTLPLVTLEKDLLSEPAIQRPANRNDYSIIRMWLHDKPSEREWEAFGDALFSSILLKTYQIEKTPKEVLGTYNIDVALVISEPQKFASKKPEEREPMISTVFRDLAKFDQSFYDFLVRRRIDPLNPVAVEKHQESSVFRKVKPLAYFRYYFNKDSGARTRRKNTFYFGKELVYKISDGNPRILINILNDLISKYISLGENSVARVFQKEQTDIISEFSEEWLSSVCNHPDVSFICRVGQENPLKELIDDIGDYFRECILGDDFKVNPTGSFIVDEEVNKEQIRLLKFALDYGVIQYLNPKKDIGTDPLKGETFRLSFTIYPNYDLPVREYEPIRLSTILTRRELKNKLQQKLFNEDQEN